MKKQQEPKPYKLETEIHFTKTRSIAHRPPTYHTWYSRVPEVVMKWKSDEGFEKYRQMCEKETDDQRVTFVQVKRIPRGAVVYPTAASG